MTPELLAALKVLISESLEDWIYDVRDSAAGSDDGFEGNRWDHPRVIAFAEACRVIEQAVLDAESLAVEPE